jgi:hypothetical protein
MVLMDLPIFDFSPNAYKLDVFEKEAGNCSCCNQNRNLKYTGTFYSEDEPDYICAWCIENGKAAAMFAGAFNDYASNENSEDIAPELLLQISERTPSYTSWQQEVWLSHCKQPCKLLGYADFKTIEPLLDELNNGIEKQRLRTSDDKKTLIKRWKFSWLFISMHTLRTT